MEINICFSSDNNYAKHMGVAITSILKNSNINDTYNFYILDGGISDSNKSIPSSYSPMLIKRLA